MPKLKTNKGLAKRVKVSPNGKIKRKRAFAGHLMSGKTGDRKRKLKSFCGLNLQRTGGK